MEQPFTLDDVVTNSELNRRKSRDPDYQAEAQALEVLAQTMAICPGTLLQKLVDLALQLCRAGTAGVSLLERQQDQVLFRWEALAGVLKDHISGTMPRYASPCGTTIDRNATQLMYLPERFFPALKIEPPIVEALLIPFRVENRPVGTVWVVTHNEDRKFDREDERIIRTLAQFAAAGFQLWQAQETAESATASARELTKDLAAANESLQVQVDSRMLAEEKLQQLNTDLEKRVTQDTLDLDAAHKDLLHSVVERNQLEDELLHSQKMETLGTLAGGIAHDFNNLLHIIQGYVTIMRKDLRNPVKLEEYIQVIDETVKEGSALTHQLLTVARKNKVKLELTSVNSLITTLVKWLQNTLAKTIEIDLKLDPKVPHIRADANQLNQVLLNLCVNARDAMADTGHLRLSTGIVPGNKLQNRFPGIDDKDYVCIAVGDTGAGMDKQVREHIFEPFFTTKEQQKGTGLGLSIVYGIITRHSGFIDVDTDPGRGTTFHIYLPVTS
jgi:signal transduction histidine kinase